MLVTMASRSSARIKSRVSRRLTSLKDDTGSSVHFKKIKPMEGACTSSSSASSPRLEDNPKAVIVKGLDFAGHCPICLKRLLSTEEDAETENSDGYDEGITTASCDVPNPTPSSPSSFSLTSMDHIWRRLHSKNGSSNLKFTFRATNAGREGASSKTADDVPTPIMCGTCHEEILKLNELHQELEAVERALKSQVETVRKIVNGNTSQRKMFEKALTSSGNNKDGKEMLSKAMQFLEYIGNEPFPVTDPHPNGRIVKSTSNHLRKRQTTQSMKRMDNPIVKLTKLDLDHIGIRSASSEESADDQEVRPMEPDLSMPETEADDIDFGNFFLIKQEIEAPDNSPLPSDPDDDFNPDNEEDDYDDDEWDEMKKKTHKKKEIGKNADVDDADGNPVPKADYQCPQSDCGMSFCTLPNLRSHFLRLHSVKLKPEQGQRLRCAKCGKIFKHPESFQFHNDFEDCTPNEKLTLTWPCPFPSCSNQSFGTRKELRCHKIAEHQGQQFPSSTCATCGKSFTHPGHYKFHLKTHEKARPVCEICGKDFKEMKYLTKHRTIHSEDKPFFCELCGMRFRLIGFLTQHKKNSHRERSAKTRRNFPCQLCGKPFHTAKYLRDHMAIHSAAKPFDCELCGKSFRSKRNMRSHLKIMHRENKPKKTIDKDKVIECKFCGKEYGNRRSVASHVKLVHTDWTPFHCGKCGKGFKSKYLWRDHQNIDHITKPGEVGPVFEESAADQENQRDEPEPEPVKMAELASSSVPMQIEIVQIEVASSEPSTGSPAAVSDNAGLEVMEMEAKMPNHL